MIMQDTVTYSSAEGSLLAQALVAFLGRTHGIRVLAIKGATASMQGLRPAKASSDADVLVDPVEMDRLLELLAERGWHPRVVPLEPNIVSPHSVTLINAEWPCDIDVHRHYPGLLGDASAVFEEFWGRRTVLEIAGTPVESVNRIGGALILALHDLRAPHGSPVEQRLTALARTIRESFSEAEREELIAVVVETRAVEPARPFLQLLGADLPTQRPRGAELAEWRALTHSPNRTILWLRELGRVPPKRKARVLWHALVSSEAELRAQHPEVGPGAGAVLALRIRRLIGGVRAFPDAVHALREDRRSGYPREERSTR